MPPATIERLSFLMAVSVTICGALAAVTLLVPPFIYPDSSFGFLAWRGTLLGSANSIIRPDPANIANNTVAFLTWWSPGQYLVPGGFSLLGMPLGIAMTLTVALSLLAALIGWVFVIRVFALQTRLAFLVILLIGCFRYSTSGFQIYHGGEILLEGATPWLILGGYTLPEMKTVPAIFLATGLVFLAFFVKLTGLIVAAAALISGGTVNLAFGRRITQGMCGGVLGTAAALAILYVTFFLQGSTPGSATSWALSFKSIMFSVLSPWVSGISWENPITLLFYRTRSTMYMPASLLVLDLLAALAVIGVFWYWRRRTTHEQKLRLFSLWFYSVTVLIMIVLHTRGGIISFEDRHTRSAGTLLLVCALANVLGSGTPKWMRNMFCALCAVMALYGVAGFAHYALVTAKGQTLDRWSWTNQQIFNAAAIDFARKAYAQEGTAALFVLPLPQLAVTLPTKARIIPGDIDLPESQIASAKYRGRVPGHIFVLLPNRILGTGKGRAFLSEFSAYASDGWHKKMFSDMSVIFQ